jgi:hypothetical protein
VGLGSGSDDGKPDGGDDVFSVEYTTTGPASPTVNGVDEAPTEDVDFARDVDARKSTTGVIFFLPNSPITWQSTKQKVVAQSSCESEYIAAANPTC